MSKIFFDANILLDLLISNRKNHKKALEVLVKVSDTYEILATSEDIITTIEYIASKNGIECMNVWEFFKTLQVHFEILNFSTILDGALERYKEQCEAKIKLDFEDLLQLECAMASNCDVFLTEDKGIHKLNVDIKIMCLDDFLIRVKKN